MPRVIVVEDDPRTRASLTAELHDDGLEVIPAGSVAEVEDQDLWQKAVLGICAVSNDRQRVNSILDQVVNFIEDTQLTRVADSQIEIINL